MGEIGGAASEGAGPDCAAAGGADSPELLLASAVRNEYSDWLDAIFKPPRQRHDGKLRPRHANHARHRLVAPEILGQHQVTSHQRHQQADHSLPSSAGTTSVLPPCPLQLSRSEHTTPIARRSNAGSRSVIDGEKSGRWRSRRRVPRPPPRRVVEHEHVTPHPAAFSDIRYDQQSSPHRPGLNFFEYIPCQANIQVASTLVFLKPEAASRLGGEVLWIRSDSAGKIQRRVFSTPTHFATKSKRLRRIALTLSGRDVCGRSDVPASAGGGAGACNRWSATPGPWGRGYRQQRQGAGTTPVRGGRRERAEQPAALLKFSSVNPSVDPGKKHGDSDGGGRSDIVVLHNTDQVEELLLQEGRSKIDTAHTGDIRDGADKKSPREESVATDPTTMKINRDAGEDPGQQGGMPKPRAELLEPGLGGIGGGSACERARPWAIQAFVKPKGPLAWMVRAVWRRGRDPYCWIISDSDPFVTSSSSLWHDGGSNGTGTGSAGMASMIFTFAELVPSLKREDGKDATPQPVRSAGGTGWTAPKATISELAKTLESSSHVRFDELVADLIEDRAGKWWLTQVKAFRLLPSPGTPLPRTVPNHQLTPTGAGRRAALYANEGGSACDHDECGDGGLNTARNPIQDIGARGHRKGAEKTTVACIDGGSNSNDNKDDDDDDDSNRSSSVVGVAVGDARLHTSRQNRDSQLLLTNAPHDHTRRRKAPSCPGKYCDSQGEGGLWDSGVEEGASVQGEKEGDADDVKEQGGNAMAATMAAAGGIKAGVVDERSFELPLKALVLNNEIAALRARVPLEHDVERGHNAGPGAAGRAHQKRGNVCAVEARALERLLKRDRVLLYDRVKLCATCYKKYGSDWRWWLNGGAEQQKDETRSFPENKATTRAKSRDKSISNEGHQRQATQANVTGVSNTTTGSNEKRNASDNTTRGHAWVGAEANHKAALALWLSTRNGISSPTSCAHANDQIAANGRVGDHTLNVMSQRGARNDPTSFRQAKYCNNHDNERVRYGQHPCSVAPCSTTTTAEARERNADTASKNSLTFFRERLHRRLDAISLGRLTGTTATCTAREKMCRTPEEKKAIASTGTGSNPCVTLEDVGMGESAALSVKGGITMESEGATTSSNISIDSGPKKTGSARSIDLSTGSRDMTTIIMSKTGTSGLFQSCDEKQRSPAGKKHDASSVNSPSTSRHMWEWEKVTVASKKTG